MEDIQEQLAALRRRIATINRKWDRKPSAMPVKTGWERPARYAIEQLMSGEVVRTAWGEHFETEKLYECHRRHGSVDLATLPELPEDLLDAISDGAIPLSNPAKWAFLDTETTGLAGGAGIYAFLVGVGHIERSGFRLRQFFMRDFGEEASLLSRLREYLAQFDVLITYNGKTYDQPLLETRFRMARARPPFERLVHLDLLRGARRLWKLRLESCRLVDLENQILGIEREGDLPGEMIPYCYFEYLRTLQAFRLVPIFHHNAMDILSLACLTAVVPFAFRAPEEAVLRHGADWIGLARWLARAERYDEALRLFRRAVDLGLPDGLLFRTLWEIGGLERRLGQKDAALEVFNDLAASRNPYRMRALEELAKHYEHSERDYATALELTRRALGLSDTIEMRRREQRLQRRLSSPRCRKMHNGEKVVQSPAPS